MAIRWRGYEHPALYTMINEGPGSAASDPQTTYWQGLSDELTKVDEDLNSSLTNLGARWEGTAAQSAQSGLTPLAAWAGDAETGSTVMKISSENQGEYISDARARMPEPVEVTTQAPSGWSMVTAGAAALTGNPGPAVQVALQAADHEAQESAQSEAEQRALETMQTYESSSTWNRDTLGTFMAPPDVVVATPAPQGSNTGTIVVLNQRRTFEPTTTNTNTGTKSPTQTGTQLTGTPQVQTGDQGDNQQVPPSNGNVDGGVTLPPSTPPATTTPSDVFVPPPGSGNPLPPGGGPFPNPGPGPVPPPGPGPNPYLPGTGPFPRGLGDTSNNAGDIARRALPPLRPGFPGAGDPFAPGRGMPGGGGLGGPGGGGLAGGLDGERSPSQLGRGGAIGGAPGQSGVVRNSPGAAGAAGGRGGGVNGPAGAGGRRADGEDDDDHYAPDYLLETDDVFGDERRVAPTVIGE